MTDAAYYGRQVTLLRGQSGYMSNTQGIPKWQIFNFNF